MESVLIIECFICKVSLLLVMYNVMQSCLTPCGAWSALACRAGYPMLGIDDRNQFDMAAS